jgi:hypothetical protein
MKLVLVFLAAMMATMTTAQAAIIELNFSGRVTDITGDINGQGFDAVFGDGTPVAISIFVDDSFDITTNPQDVVDGRYVFGAPGLSATAASQRCCTNNAEVDPTDGSISWSGSLGGFTASPSIEGPYQLIAAQYELTFTVDGVDVPLSTFSSTNDLLAFLALPSLVVSGSVRGAFVNGGTGNPDFAQRLLFTTATPSEVPLPGAALFFITGLGGFLAKRKKAS